MLAPLEGCCYSLDIIVISFFFGLCMSCVFLSVSLSPARWTDVLYFTTLASLFFFFSHPLVHYRLFSGLFVDLSHRSYSLSI